jgi:hypothetical protein
MRLLVVTSAHNFDRENETMAFAGYWQHGLAFVVIAAFDLVSPASKPQSLSAQPSTVTAQAPAEPSAASGATSRDVVPKDRKELLLAAARVNGLDAPGLQPWHILVTYDEFDEDGDNVDSGTYEEFWVGPKQYRLSYTSPDFTQTDIASERGLFRTGNQKWPGELQTRVRDEFVRPMFREMNLEYAKTEKRTRDFGKVQLPCVLLRGTGGGNLIISDNGLAGFCFEPDSLMLRYSKGGMAIGTTWDQIGYDKIVRFQGRYVARDIRVMQGGNKHLNLHLEKLEPIAEVSAVDFTPPPGAVALDTKLITLDNRVLNLDYLVHNPLPQFPTSIRPPGGAATMKYVIGKDGRVRAIQFLEGTAEMKKGLEESLRKYVYRPFLVMGEPVEIDVTQKFGYEIH